MAMASTSFIPAERVFNATIPAQDMVLYIAREAILELFKKDEEFIAHKVHTFQVIVSANMEDEILTPVLVKTK